MDLMTLMAGIVRVIFRFKQRDSVSTLLARPAAVCCYIFILVSCSRPTYMTGRGRHARHRQCI
jgi:hypothetical protein